MGPKTKKDSERPKKSERPEEEKDLKKKSQKKITITLEIKDTIMLCGNSKITMAIATLACCFGAAYSTEAVRITSAGRKFLEWKMTLRAKGQDQPRSYVSTWAYGAEKKNGMTVGSRARLSRDYSRIENTRYETDWDRYYTTGNSDVKMNYGRNSYDVELETRTVDDSTGDKGPVKSEKFVFKDLSLTLFLKMPLFQRLKFEGAQKLGRIFADSNVSNVRRRLNATQTDRVAERLLRTCTMLKK